MHPADVANEYFLYFGDSETKKKNVDWWTKTINSSSDTYTIHKKKTRTDNTKYMSIEICDDAHSVA